MYNTYMHLWVSLGGVPSMEFLIDKRNTNYPRFVSWHLSLTIWFIYSNLFFWISMETVTELSDMAIEESHAECSIQVESEVETRSTNYGTQYNTGNASWASLKNMKQ